MEKVFYTGQASGLVEPIAGVLGVFMALTMEVYYLYYYHSQQVLWLELYHQNLFLRLVLKIENLTTIGVIVGFSLMMILDVALG